MKREAPGSSTGSASWRCLGCDADSYCGHSEWAPSRTSLFTHACIWPKELESQHKPSRVLSSKASMLCQIEGSFFCFLYQAPPRILRSRFRKKSTSSSATETTWVRWANSTGSTECFFSALKSYLFTNNIETRKLVYWACSLGHGLSSLLCSTFKSFSSPLLFFLLLGRG